MGALTGWRDAGAFGGLRQQPYADPNGSLVQHSTNDPLILSSGSVGYNISDANTRFPNAMALLTDAGFSNTEKLQSTYPWCVYTELELLGEGGYGGTGWNNRTPIYIPPGVWMMNREVRSGQHRNIGGSCGFNAGSGATVIKRIDTNWKSIHGTQNANLRILFHGNYYCGEQNLTPQPIGIGGGQEYNHAFSVEEMTLLGTGNELAPFWNTSVVEAGVLLYNSGESTLVSRCWINDWVGFGVLNSHNMARPRVSQCSMFRNSIAAIGQRGGTNSKIVYNDLSCDNNPYVLFLFAGGCNVFGTGAFLPHANSTTPGGAISFNDIKVEAFACRSGYDVMSACNPNFIGKGGMWARLSGDYQFACRDSTLNVHGGRIHSAIEVIDELDMQAVAPGQGWTGVPADNSSVILEGAKVAGVANMMHDWKRQRTWTIAEPAARHYRPNLRFTDMFDSGNAFYLSPGSNGNWATAPLTYRGRMPFINQNQALSWGASPSFNYDVIRGTNY